MTQIKICGLQSVEVLKSISNLEIDFCGFVFAESKRRVSPQRAAELCAAAGLRAKKVGVFVDPDLREIDAVVRKVPLDYVQLHGRETPEFCARVKREFGVGVIKAFHVRAGEAGEPWERETVPLPDERYGQAIDWLLLDTYDQRAAGGTGKTFRWETIPAYQEWAGRFGLPVIVAGGISAENVAALLEAYRPDAVDVSSGVETNGRKDEAKIAEFVERVKRFANGPGS
ncbi:phosphoribosylanthranilate isomerase [Bacillaceae bacterium]